MEYNKGSAWIFILIGTLLTASLGLYNNFPFLYPDTAAYLESGILGYVPLDRPIFYGLFLRATHMMDNLYFSMLWQCLLLAYVAYLPFKIFKPVKNYGVAYLIVILVLTLTTSWSFYGCYLMPDFFGVILFITTWLLLFARLGRTHTVICIVLLTYSILVHNAHLFLFLGVAAIYLMLVLFTKASLIPIKRIGLLVSIVIALAFSTAFLVNTGFGRNTVFGGSSHLFLTSRLNETGILHEFLERKCGSTDYPLCTYKDSLTGDYLWDPKSPMHKIGGVQADKSGYDHMLGDMITDPHTVKRILVMALNSTVLQFFSFEIEPHNPLRLSYIKERFAVHRHDMDISFQNRGNRLDYTSSPTFSRACCSDVFGSGARK
jgi:hypothetical protein